MIIPNPKHIFQKCFPQLEKGEEEIFYPHPEWDIKVNQIGVVYPGESMTYYSYSALSDKVNINDLKTVKTSSPKNKIIAQCYAGSMDVPFTIRPLDGNPYNYTKENLLWNEKHKKEASEKYKAFKYNTLEYMLKKDEELKARGLFPGMYWALQKLPYYIRTLYEDETGHSLALDKYGFPKQTSWGEQKTKRNTSNVEEKLVKDPRGRKRTRAEVNVLRKRAHELSKQGMNKAQIGREMKELSTYVHYLLNSPYQDVEWDSEGNI
jgi:hypothetical protein